MANTQSKYLYIKMPGGGFVTILLLHISTTRQTCKSQTLQMCVSSAILCFKKRHKDLIYLYMFMTCIDVIKSSCSSDWSVCQCHVEGA